MHCYVCYWCVSTYLKSVLRYKFLIFDTYHPPTLYLCEQWCEEPWLFFAAKRGPRAKYFGKHWFKGYRKSLFKKRKSEFFLVVSTVFVYLLPENRNWPKISDALSHRISTECVKKFIGHILKTVYSIMWSRSITDLYEQKSELRNNF